MGKWRVALLFTLVLSSCPRPTQSPANPGPTVGAAVFHVGPRDVEFHPKTPRPGVTFGKYVHVAMARTAAPATGAPAACGPPTCLGCPSTCTSNSTSATLCYSGGVIIPSVQVVPVFWSSSVNSKITTNVGGFFSALLNGPYLGWLSEYDTVSPNFCNGSSGPPSNQSFGGGSLGSTYTITPSSAHAGSALQDSDVADEISQQLTNNKLPAPTGNTLFVIYLPDNVTVNSGGLVTCSAICGYHHSLTYNGANVFYAVLAPIDNCTSVCGGNPGGWFNDLTSVSTHEIVEAITDPVVGTAWNDSTTTDKCCGGEIGDLCDFEEVPAFDGFTVQKEWSNANGRCYAPCGRLNVPCCASGSACTDSGTVCSKGICVACGGGNQPCCKTGQACQTNYSCQGTTCLPCGSFNQPCCPSQFVSCNPPTTCNTSTNLCTCSGPGQACARNADCCSTECVSGKCGCTPVGASCGGNGDCCSQRCNAGTCGCVALGWQCSGVVCCGGAVCQGGFCTPYRPPSSCNGFPVPLRPCSAQWVCCGPDQGWVCGRCY